MYRSEISLRHRNYAVAVWRMQRGGFAPPRKLLFNMGHTFGRWRLFGGCFGRAQVKRFFLCREGIDPDFCA